MKTSPLARLDELIRHLGTSNWISPRQVAELKEISRELHSLRTMSDSVRIAIYQLLNSVRIHENGRVTVMHSTEFYSAISELNRILDEVRPRGANEKWG